MTGPKRLLESGDSELARSLGAAQGHLPGPERLAALGERLAELGLPTTEPSGVKPTPETAPAPAPPPSPAGSLLLKGVAGALATGGVVLTLALALPEKEASQPAPASQSAPVARSAATSERAALAASATRAAPAPRAVEPTAAVVEAPAAPLASTPGREPIAARSVTASSAPPRRSAAEPAAALPTAAAPPVASEAPALAAPQATPGEASAGTGELRRAPTPSEVELLKEARRVLSSDPERALLLTRRYGAEYPRGTYAQERDFIAISALSRLGRRAEAQARGDAFRARYPRSAYLPQLERLLGGR